MPRTYRIPREARGKAVVCERALPVSADRKGAFVMSTAATDPQDRREQAKPAVSERQREKAVLNLLFGGEYGYPWSVEELVQMIGNRLDTVDALCRLEAAGLLHRLDGFVFGIGPERLRQLLNRHVRQTTGMAVDAKAMSRAATVARRAKDLALAQARAEDLLAAWRAGEKLEGIAGRFGLRCRSVAQVRRWAEDRCGPCGPCACARALAQTSRLIAATSRGTVLGWAPDRGASDGVRSALIVRQSR